MDQNIPTRLNNPGSLKDPSTGNFRQFNSPQEGYAALLNDLEGKKTGKTQTGLGPQSTLVDFANVYAPKGDKNDPAQYAANLANHMKIRPDATLSSLDTGKWADAVAHSEGYQGNQTTQSGTSQPTIPAETQPTQEPGLLDELKNRGNDIGDAFKLGTSGTVHGALSGALQGVGAVAGGVGDVVNKGLELIPGIKEVEGAIGQGVGALAKTPAGQSVMKYMAEFSKAHPELSKDIGAGFNIITAIPIFRGLGAVKNIALDSISSSLARFAEKGATKDLTAAISRTVGGRNILKETPEAISTLVKERAIPNIEGGKYSTQEAYDNLGSSISNIEDNELQTALAKANPEVRNLHWTEDTGLPNIEDLRKEAIANIKKELAGTGNQDLAESRINKIFDENKAKYGDYPTLQQINDMKRIVRKGVNFNSPQVDHDVKYITGQTFQKAIEDGANRLGLGDVNAINKKMAALIQAQKALKYIEGKPVKSGWVGGLIKEGVKDATTLGGEALGNITGVPFAGTLAGRGVGGLISRGLEKSTSKNILREGILSRTGKNAVKQPLKTSLKRVTGLLGAGTVNKVQNQ